MMGPKGWLSTQWSLKHQPSKPKGNIFIQLVTTSKCLASPGSLLDFFKNSHAFLSGNCWYHFVFNLCIKPHPFCHLLLQLIVAAIYILGLCKFLNVLLLILLLIPSPWCPRGSLPQEIFCLPHYALPTNLFKPQCPTFCQSNLKGQICLDRQKIMENARNMSKYLHPVERKNMDMYIYMAKNTTK